MLPTKFTYMSYVVNLHQKRESHDATLLSDAKALSEE